MATTLRGEGPSIGDRALAPSGSVDDVTPAVIVFDVNETLLDLSSLRPVLEERLGTSEPLGEWFARLLHGSLVANATGRYRPFGTIGIEALRLVAAKRGLDLTVDDAEAVVAVMRRLEPHPDVVPGLERLAAAGYRMATLTNGSSDAAADQIAHANLQRFFEQILSVDDVERFKPAPQVYLLASVRLGVDVDEMLLVAAHDWDVVGARAVGMNGAYLARPGAVWSLPDPMPELVAENLTALADLLDA